MAYLGKTPSQAVRSRYYFTATGGETSLSGTDDNSNTLTFSDGNYVDVALNGVTLVAGTDYNTTTANTIGGLTALAASDVVEIIVYDTFSVFSGNVNSDFSVGGDLTITGTTTTSGNINFGDNDKAIFGAGNDLQIYHDGSNSIIAEASVGSLKIQGSDLYLTDDDGTNMIYAANNAGVSLYYGGGATLATASTGVDITGAISVTGGITNLIRTQVFTASGTYTPATNATKAIVHVVGAGGGGGGCEGTVSGEGGAGGGGASGGVIISDVIDVSGGSYTSTITIGAAGVGANNTDGTDGGNTSYADGTITLTASGGSGGSREPASTIFHNAPPGTGNANTVSGHTPIIDTKGENGGTGLTLVDSDISNMVISGFGGSSYPYGQGGTERQRTTNGSSNGQDASGYGGGGAGAVTRHTTGAKAGGNGTAGVVIVFEYL